MTIAERREAVRFLEGSGVSVQRACVLVQLHRSTLHYQPRFRDFFAITARDGRVQSLQGSYGIVVACRR